MAVPRRASVYAIAAATLGIGIALAARAAPAPGSDGGAAAAGAVAVHHRIQLPDGSQIMLRREYRVIFRTPMRWSEGLLLERVYFADGVPFPARSCAGCGSAIDTGIGGAPRTG